jgi:hypothetical protein
MSAEAKAVATRMQAPLESLPEAMTPMTMLDRAVASGANIEVIEKLMGLQERWEANQARKAFDNAMAAAKAEIPVILKDREVDFVGKTGIRTHYHHESLAEIARTVDPILAKHGLSYRFETESADRIHVICIISHRDGHSVRNGLSAPRDDSGNKNPIQGIGSTISFLQRYTLKSGLGLAAAKDDDAAGAGGNGNGEPISEDQVLAIQSLIKEVNADTVKLCKYFKVGALTEIPATKFDAVIEALESKRKKA